MCTQIKIVTVQGATPSFFAVVVILFLLSVVFSVVRTDADLVARIRNRWPLTFPMVQQQSGFTIGSRPHIVQKQLNSPRNHKADWEENRASMQYVF
jgi:hypothetical protein